MSTPNTNPNESTVQLIKDTIEKDYLWLKAQEQSAWSKVSFVFFSILNHVESISKSTMYLSVAAFVVKVFNHIV
jgi:hypothetical protein